ncbi:MAG: hypothetical protein HY585_01510, partial [Candidatus Omnitrophica bacterium]|nr:hypothetical protein [Candidatus Omnitrophota bacterium]
MSLRVPIVYSEMSHEAHDPSTAPTTEMVHESKHEVNTMNGLFGEYPMTREASGTSWQPESSPHEGLHLMKEDWRFMAHGSANVVYDDQGGKRGRRDVYSANMIMGTARR